MKKLSYREGTWFAIPLQDNKGYAVGLVARMAPKGKVIFAYFFGPIRDKVPSLAEVSNFQLKDSIKYLKVGDLGLINGKWPIIGESQPWDRTLWPMPEFIRKGLLSSASWRVTYSDSDPNKVIKEEPTPYDTPGLQADSLSGYVAAQIKITMLLDDEYKP